VGLLSRVLTGFVTGGLSEVPHQFKVAKQIVLPVLKDALAVVRPTQPVHDQTMGNPVSGYQYPYTQQYNQPQFQQAYGGDPWAFSTPSQGFSPQSPYYQGPYRQNSERDWESLNLY
jgi:hypothetical protein